MREYVLNLMTGSVGALLISAAARALPDPAPRGSRVYLWLFRFAHYVLANFDKAGIRDESKPGGN
ncbi:exported hypothetical protein [Candidatus Sulfopaludibacter sp. SbA3]|nr:exported hypothetical protein [Candidatus Sulfopaludibacter sp. SbA3]